MTLFLFLFFGAFAEESKYLKFLKADIQKNVCKFNFEVEKGFHIQANPASAPNLIATVLTFEASNQIEFSQPPQYPQAKSYSLKGFGSLAAYSEKFSITVPCKSKGKGSISGKLRYQACNEKTCFFPMTLPFKASF